MPKLSSVEDLARVHEDACGALEARRSGETVIFIGMGTCGVAAGARETMQAVRDELARRGIEATIESVGCIGMCVKEPLVDIQQAGGPRITYCNVRPDMVPRLIEEHLVQGRPVAEWIIGRMPADW